MKSGVPYVPVALSSVFILLLRVPDEVSLVVGYGGV